jgi:hypothetical protein
MYSPESVLITLLMEKLDNSPIGVVLMEKLDNSPIGVVLMEKLDNSPIGVVLMEKLDNSHIENLIITLCMIVMLIFSSNTCNADLQIKTQGYMYSHKPW